MIYQTPAFQSSLDSPNGGSWGIRFEGDMRIFQRLPRPAKGVVSINPTHEE